MERLFNSMLLETSLSDLTPISSRQLPVKIANILRKLGTKDEFMYMVLKEKTHWYISSNPSDTAGIAWDPNHPNELMLLVGPKCINGSENELAFTLAHEFAHFFRKHLDDGIYTGKPDHDIANIAEDSLINDDLFKAGSFAGYKLKPPFAVFTLKTPEYAGIKMGYLEGPDQMNEKFDGNISSKGVYDWLMKNPKEVKKLKGEDGQKPQGPGGDPGGGSSTPMPPTFPKVGDIVRNQHTGEYGRVTKVDKKSRHVDYEPVDPKDVEAEVNKSSGKKSAGGKGNGDDPENGGSYTPMESFSQLFQNFLVEGRR